MGMMRGHAKISCKGIWKLFRPNTCPFFKRQQRSFCLKSTSNDGQVLTNQTVTFVGKLRKILALTEFWAITLNKELKRSTSRRRYHEKILRIII